MDETLDGSDETPTESNQRRPRRMPLGVLTLIVIVVVGIGVMVFGDESEPAVTVPDLEGALGLPTQNGEAAPDFSIDLLDGTTFRLTDHLRDDRRPVILNLWASWCGPCRAEMPAFDAVSKVQTDVLFLGVAVQDDPGAAAQFAEEIGVSYPLAIDDADRVGRRYPSPGLPATYFISADGVIVRTVFGQLDEDQLAELITGLFGI
jgi:thiol-disulfide isomerase/thioredoxin